MDQIPLNAVFKVYCLLNYMYVYDRHSEYYLNIIVVNILFVRKLYYTLIYYTILSGLHIHVNDK